MCIGKVEYKYEDGNKHECEWAGRYEIEKSSEGGLKFKRVQIITVSSKLWLRSRHVLTVGDRIQRIPTRTWRRRSNWANVKCILEGRFEKWTLFDTFANFIWSSTMSVLTQAILLNPAEFPHSVGVNSAEMLKQGADRKLPRAECEPEGTPDLGMVY